ncbi:MAG: prenyltransferase, partial [Chloroflexi bacterium]|nr:prenyltransferase [Chloroflexota bacterium]
QKFRGLLHLTRWKEHIIFTLPLTLLGINLALDQHNHVALNGQALLIIAANVLAVTFAFMINEIEDSPDDARDPTRTIPNAVARGELTVRESWIASLIVGGVALLFFWLLGGPVIWIGALTLVLALLYSWRGVRLKALPLVDVLSHVLMLSSLLFLAGYLVYADPTAEIGLVTLGMALISGYGQFYNQLRDYEVDRATGLHNTASLAGPHLTRWLMSACLGLAGIFLLLTLVLGLWPWWLVGAAVLISPIMLLVMPQTDLRGSAVVDRSGRAQLSFLIVSNTLLIVWLIINWIG